MSLYSQSYGDIDEASSSQQIKKVYKPSAKNDAEVSKDIDEGHGGINVIVEVKDGAASANTMTMHSSSAPTPEDMGFM